MQNGINHLTKKIALKWGIDFDKKVHPILEPDGQGAEDLEEMCEKFTSVANNMEQLNKSPDFPWWSPDKG